MHMLKRGVFLVRTLLHERPFLLIFLTVSCNLGLSGILLRIFERSVPSATVKSFYDSLWLVAYTQCTIGYGDVTAVTHIGRLLCVCAGVSGVLTLSLLVSTLVGSVGLSVKEKVFLTALYSKHTSRTRLFNLAVVLLQRWWRLTRARMNKWSRFHILGKYASIMTRFRMRHRLLISKENPEVDELIHNAKQRIHQELTNYIQRLRNLKRFSHQMAKLSTRLALLTTKFMTVRRAAARAAKLSQTFNNRLADRSRKRTWTSRTMRSSLIASKRSKDSAYKKMLTQITERDKMNLFHATSDPHRVSMATTEL